MFGSLRNVSAVIVIVAFVLKGECFPILDRCRISAAQQFKFSFDLFSDFITQQTFSVDDSSGLQTSQFSAETLFLRSRTGSINVAWHCLCLPQKVVVYLAAYVAPNLHLVYC